MERPEREGSVERPEREEPRIANNRLAVAVVVGSLLAVVALVGYAFVGSPLGLLPERPPDISLLPLYAIGIVLLVGLVVWSWDRVASFFEDA